MDAAIRVVGRFGGRSEIVAEAKVMPNGLLFIRLDDKHVPAGWIEIVVDPEKVGNYIGEADVNGVIETVEVPVQCGR